MVSECSFVNDVVGGFASKEADLPPPDPLRSLCPGNCGGLQRPLRNFHAAFAFLASRSQLPGLPV